MKGPNDITPEATSTVPAEVVMVGVPWDGGSSYLRGCAMAPARIREAMLSRARNLVTESGLHLARESRFRVLSDLEIPEHDPLAAIESAIGKLLARGARVLSLGGDHAITLALMRAFGRLFRPLTLVQIDAHPDLYDEFEGDRFSHACPMSRIMEEGLTARLIQVGVRATSPHQRAQAERFGVEVIEMRDWRQVRGSALELAGPLYLSIDLDGLDPACAPGVSHPEPGGLTTREVIELLQGLPRPLVGADIVELNPVRDPQGLTAVVAAKLAKEVVAKLLEVEEA